MTTQVRHQKRRRTGRPPKDAAAVPTRERLLDAAASAFVEHGYSSATIGDIAVRAGISGPGVYKHFRDKAELLLAAAQWHLASTTAADGFDPHASVDLWLSPDFQTTRTLLLELHLTSGRDSSVAEMLAAWHHSRATAWREAADVSPAQVKTFYLLLLGLSHVDALPTLAGDNNELREHAHRMVDALFERTQSSDI